MMNQARATQCEIGDLQHKIQDPREKGKGTNQVTNQNMGKISEICRSNGDNWQTMIRNSERTKHAHRWASPKPQTCLTITTNTTREGRPLLCTNQNKTDRSGAEMDT